MTIASTGLSVHAAEALGFNVEWVTIHPPKHVTYYPESWPMTLRVVFDRDIGLILGAQVTGLEGVDKRIDVLATCIQAAMTMHDLKHLELSYAPQYSSAKGPINMAGFVGGNVVGGNVRILHPEDLANLTDDWELVDVRSDEDFFESHLRGAISVPLERLRGSAKVLIDQVKRILLYSEVGYRGYLAYRILDQTGWDVYNLDGGFKSVVQSGVHLPHDMATHRIRGCKKESGVP
jgi:rhodanese-related sulfurtransferase